MSKRPIRADLDHDSLMGWVKRRLGHPNVDIELMPENYEDAIEDAFELYSRYRPVIKRHMFTVSEAERDYSTIGPTTPPSSLTSSAGVAPSTGGGARFKLPYVGRGVVEVQPHRGSTFLVPGSAFSLNLGDGVVSTVVPALMNSSGIDEIHEILVYSEMWRRVLSWDFQWEIVGDYLYVANLPPEVALLGVVYVEDHDFVTLPRCDRDWIKKYTLALCKQMLGRVRGKFNLAGPAGQPMLQDGPGLVQEGQQEEEKLDLVMQRRAYPLPPTWDDKPV